MEKPTPKEQKVTSMNHHEKMLHLLNRHYSNIDGYKKYRINIPYMFSLAIFAITSLTLKEKGTIDPWQGSLSLIGIVLIAIIGIITHRLVRKTYDAIYNEIQYLQEGLGIVGESFFTQTEKQENNEGRRVKLKSVTKLLNMGFWVIIIASLICLAIISLKIYSS